MGREIREHDGGMRYLCGVILLPVGLFLGLSLFSYDWRAIGMLQDPAAFAQGWNLIGPVGAWLSFGLLMSFGMAAFLVPFWCLGFGIALLAGEIEQIGMRVFWCFLATVALGCIVQLHNPWPETAGGLNIQPYAGGVIAWMITSVLLYLVRPVGTGILVWPLFLIAVAMIPGPANLARLGRCILALYQRQIARLRERMEERQNEQQRLEREERGLEKQRRKLERTMQRQKRKKRLTAAGELVQEKLPTPEPELKPGKQKAPKPRRSAKVGKTARNKPAPAPEPTPSGEYQLPPLSLLTKPASTAELSIKADSGTTGKILCETLLEFGIEAEVTNVEQGPVVTRYELLPAPGVRVERISGLANNLALSLKATSVRVQAPIPGKGVVGIEVPNSVANMVYLHELLDGELWQSDKAKLPLALGKDVGGSDIVGDLADMPHLLVAGATGAGKTVCMNSILAGLLMSRTPAQLRLLLVDPKIVEFAIYTNLPHLVVPVITDPKKVALGLRWAINEMEKRYKLFAKTGVRNIEGFNNRVMATQEDLFDNAAATSQESAAMPEALPYIVIVIDELADLMLVDQAGIENCVARLAQLSRAVGIHMILSTQRPSVNVITGTIKANFPARIAFQVAQKVDSRTILDSIGAEKLLGRGDMLFQPPGSAKLTRAQGAMTSDEDTRKIVDFIQKQAGPTYELSIKEKIEKKGPVIDGDGEDEELIAQSVEIIRETQRASTSSLQRRLRIGYTRAARIMDILESRGIVGPPRGSDPREILVDLDGEIPDNPDTEPGA